MSIKKQIPNILTLGNVFLGCIAILSLFEGEYKMVFWCTFAAGWLDLGDGLAARALNVKSEMGKELDSLADMVTFGVLPGFVLYHLISESLDGESAYWAYAGFLVTVASAYRLAKFNLDTRQSVNFIGVPTPANAGFIIGLLLLWHFDELGLQPFLTTPVLVVLSLICAYLLNSHWLMFSFKMKNMQWKGNEVRFSYLIITLGLIPILGWSVFAVGFIIYVALSILFKKYIVE